MGTIPFPKNFTNDPIHSKKFGGFPVNLRNLMFFFNFVLLIALSPNNIILFKISGSGGFIPIRKDVLERYFIRGDLYGQSCKHPG